MIDMASVYAERYKQNPQALQAAVLGQSPDPRLDPYTALNALRLVKESNMMAMSRQAQQPTSAPSIVAQNMAPNPMQQGLGAMVPGAMGQGAPAPQGTPPQAPAAPAPVMQRSGGLAGLPTKDFGYARGGIVAFKDEGLVRGETEEDYQGETRDTGYSDSQGRSTDAEGNLLDDEDDGSGGSTGQGDFNAYLMKSLKAMGNYNPKEMSEADQDALFKKYLAREETMAGPNIYDPANADLKKRESAIAGNERYGQGLAMIGAAGQLLKGRNLAEGASNAAPAFAQQMAEVKRATIQEQRSIEQMKFAYADAQRKERVGNIRAATSSMEAARKFQQDANNAHFNKLKGMADLAAKGAQANRPYARGAGANAGPKVAEQLAAAEIDFSQNPTKENKVKVEALRRTQAQLAQKQTFSLSDVPEGGPKAGALTSQANLGNAKLDADIVEKATKTVNDSILSDPAYRAARTAERRALQNKVPYTGMTTEQIRNDYIAKEVKRIKGQGAGGGGAPGTAGNPIKLN
jgi:hypothetical protein